MEYRCIVSVIVPVYNAEKYLSRCIESILGQTLSSIELILINDGSTDQSAGIFNYYASQDERIKVIHIENNGPGNARNVGLEHAKGKYIQFTDSDDTLPPNFLEVLHNRMETENPDLVVCGSKLVKNNREIDKLTVCEFESYHDKPIIELFVNLLEKGLAYSSWNKLYRKELIRNHKIRFGTEFHLGEDAIFNISYFRNSTKVSFEPGVSYEYHQNEGSLVNRYLHNKFEIQKLLYGFLRSLINGVPCTHLKEGLILYYQYEFAFAFINYYLPDCPMNSIDRKKMISMMIKDEIVQEIFALPNHRSNLQKMIRRLVRLKSATFMDLFLRAYRRRYL
ncbi:glycosyltransferase [Neobacillus sp. YIM B06451]|uniref:glycosyltransferase family 2 protein n=1 Tax=Neobacillus sp. YIM B06451 TaxID=3070994 RepID=UPI00292D62E3|nr:glycosyltransferase [Neobacillus sp. YIM B06451]